MSSQQACNVSTLFVPTLQLSTLGLKEAARGLTQGHSHAQGRSGAWASGVGQWGVDGSTRMRPESYMALT